MEIYHLIRRVLTVILLTICWSCIGPPPVLTYKEQLVEDYVHLLDHNQRKNLLTMDSDSLAGDYIDSLWTTWDPDPQTSANELLQEYYQRLKKARKRYPTMRGWPRSDRARVFILYGEPDEIIYDKWISFKVDGFKEYKAVEVWIYNRSAGPVPMPYFLSSLYPGAMKFGFADIAGFRQFEQVFSTEAGEKFSPDIYNTRE